MALVETRHKPTTAALVAMLLQPSTVFTKGDITRLYKMLDVGVTQGCPESPTLFNIMPDFLLSGIARALENHLPPGAPRPANGFADDLFLQLLQILNAKRALAACTTWVEETGQEFATGERKSACLIEHSATTNPGFEVTGKEILPALAFEY